MWQKLTLVSSTVANLQYSTGNWPKWGLEHTMLPVPLIWRAANAILNMLVKGEQVRTLPAPPPPTLYNFPPFIAAKPSHPLALHCLQPFHHPFQLWIPFLGTLHSHQHFFYHQPSCFKVFSNLHTPVKQGALKVPLYVLNHPSHPKPPPLITSPPPTYLWLELQEGNS